MSVLRKLRQTFPDGKVTSKRWFNICCPDCADKGHSPDTKYKMGINYVHGYTHCFRCKTRHKLVYFLNKVGATGCEDLNFDNKEVLVTKTIIQFPTEFINCIDLLDERYPIYAKAMEYIGSRVGFDLALKLNIGFCSTGKYANRIVVPMFNENDTIIYFIARAMQKFVSPKILNPKGERRAILYNWNVAQKFSEIYLMEGVFGALTMYPYGVATLGKEITEEQILAILRSSVKIVNIVLDGSATQDAYKVAEKISALTSKVKIKVLELKPECQPDDMSFEYLLRLKGLTPYYTGNPFI